MACGDLGDLLLAVRQEFVQRRIEQPDRHRQAAHDLEQLDEIAALHRQQLGERGAARLSRRRPGSSRAPPGCGPRRRTCARCGTARCPRRRTCTAARASAGVSALARTPSLRTLSAQPISVRELAGQLPARIIVTLPASTWPVEPSMVMISPFLNSLARRPSWSARCNRRAASRRRRRRACPCRARPRRRARSCRRAW